MAELSKEAKSLLDDCSDMGFEVIRCSSAARMTDDPMPRSYQLRLLKYTAQNLMRVVDTLEIEESND